MSFFKRKIKALWPLLYLPFIYIPWFLLLEKYVTSNYTTIYCPLDNMIPFCKYFIIPYFLWFLYVPAVFAYVLIKDTCDFYKLCAYTFIGCSLCLLIYTIFPNGQEMRIPIEQLSGEKDIFGCIVSSLYTIDTSTNVFPSIHVYNSLCCHIALSKSLKEKKPFIKTASLILTILICVSTVTLKQHSILDAVGAVTLAVILYPVIYKLVKAK